MGNGNRQAEFNVEARLAELKLNPVQRLHAQSAFRAAEDWVGVFQALTAALKRIAAAMSLKPSVRT